MRSAFRLVPVLLAAALAACDAPSNEYKPPPPPQVTVAQPERREVTDYLVYTGRTAGIEEIEIRARVEGFIEEIHFRAGQRVMPADMLFTIDPRQFVAKLEQTKAEMAGAEAELKLAEVTLERAKAAFDKQAVSEIELRQNIAARDQAAAAVALAKANVDAAMLDVEFTQVRSPIEGIVSRNLVDVGALVGKGEPTLLATVVAGGRIYAYFDISENDLLRILRDRPNHGEERTDGPVRRRVLLSFTDGGNEVIEGELDAVDNRIDPATGTLQCRAVFSNEAGLIVPGIYVRLQIEMWQSEAVLVPEIAVGADQAGRYVLVVSDAGDVERRGVVTGGLEKGNLRRVTEGLKGDEWIVVNGVQMARPGAKVTPVRQTAPAPAPSPASAAPAVREG